MSIHINILKAELEETRKKISEQLSMVGRSIQSIDPTLYDKEEVLEQAIAMWRVEFDEEEQAVINAQVTLQDLLTEYKD